MSGEAERPKCFAADTMLGRLAKWLRILGFDTRSMVLADPGVIESLISGGFIPVTRREKFQDFIGVVFIRSDHHFEQLMELISLVSITRDEVRLFARCTLCNAALMRVPVEAVFGAVPDYVFETATDFRRCPECGRVYWPGSHRRKMVGKLESLTGWSLSEGEESGTQ
jgi:uncharacterized protein with PIN domain